MTDEQWQWLSTIQKYNNNDPKKQNRHQDGHIIGGTRQLTQMLGVRTKEELQQFARFALSLPNDTAADYFA